MKKAVALSVFLALAAWAQAPACEDVPIDYDGDYLPKVLLTLTAEQMEDLARQREKNDKVNLYEATLVFTAEQLEDIKRVCPACRATSITASPDCFVSGTVLLYFDDAGGVSAEAMPYRNR